MLQFLEQKLYADVEGTCSGQFGYIIAVVSILDIGKGIVLSGNGQAEFVTRYRAIVFKPFKGEVLDGVVTSVLQVSAFFYWDLMIFIICRWVSSLILVL
jgi:DNA-directed RNA polymerase II subunit RPB7